MSDKKNSDYSVEILAKESSEDSSEVYSNGNTNSSSLPYFEENKEMILLEDSPTKDNFLRNTSYYFLIYYSIWCLAIIFIIKFDKNFLASYFFYSFFMFSFLSLGIRIGFAFYKNKLRQYLFYFYLSDLFLIFLIVIGSKELVREDDTFFKQYEYIFDYFILFGFAGFVSILGYIISTFIKTKSDVVNTLLGIVFSNIFVAPMIFLLPSIIPENDNLGNNIEYLDLGLFFGFVFFYNIFLSFDFYLVLTRSAHKYAKDDFGMIYFLFWTDIFYRFWKNLIFRERRLEKDHWEEPVVVDEHDTVIKV